MLKRKPLSNAGRLYVGTVIATGVLCLVDSVYTLSVNPVGNKWLMLAGLTLLSGSFTVRIPGIPAHLSVSETFVFVTVLMFGPSAATMIVVLDTLVISFWLRRRARQPPAQVAFNIAAPSVAIWVASHTFYELTGIQPLLNASQPDLALIVPLLGLATLYFLLNSWLIAFAVAFQKGKPALAIWKQSFLWLSLNFYSSASVAALLLPYIQQSTGNAFLYVVGILLPVLLISYLTFKTALGRVEDANRHLTELNRLYLSTIETLAMAIDAKDQITHGHIRRVQQYAVGLAKHLGITEQAQISAIEAASLLHDMGKLAVPEYILNKPGKLTPAEFEKMKLHASVGADILSAIDFPYPVVPIVRHHHENWDGTGYPDGLRGINIPVGARILSVVDCFDALTSDRPYRPRLTDGDAIQILKNRRGSMYDPLVVDAFLAVYPQIAPVRLESSATPEASLAAISFGNNAPEARSHSSRLDDITGSTEEMLVLYELAKGLSVPLELSDLGDVIGKHLRRLVPASLCVFYIYDAESDELVAAHIHGESSSNIKALRIPRGERLSGWVAANRRSILNSDPVLDLGDIARTSRPRLMSCVSAPMIAQNQVIGVLTMYATQVEAFNDDHRRILELVAKQVAQSVKGAVEFETHRLTHLRDHVTGLPNLKHLERLFGADVDGGSSIALVLMRLNLSGRFATRVGPERALHDLAGAIRGGLRGGDLLFRNASDEFVVLLANSDAIAAQLVRERIADRIRETLVQVSLAGSGNDLAVGIAATPTDGTTVDELLGAARRRWAAPSSSASPSVH